MDRVLEGTAASASVSFYADGAIVDPGVVTVTVTREDGTVVVTGAATTGTGAAARTYALSAVVTATLDVLTLAWVSPTYGTITTTIEVVGGHVCSIADIDRVLARGGTASDYSTALKLDARSVATEAFELEAGVAFSPRYAHAKFRGEDSYTITLPTPRVRSVRAVSVADTALTVDELADVDVDETRGEMSRALGWPAGSWGQRNIDVTWEHGWTTPPADVSRAVALIAGAILADGPWDDRGYGVTEGGGMVRLLTAGVQGAAFSIPEVQAALARHRHPRVA